MEHFDVFVVGTGVAGQTVAGEAAEAGKRVAVTDVREYGGTCSRRGCIPKKVLYTAAESVERVRAHVGAGVAGDVRIDWAGLVAFKRTFTEPVPERIEQWLSGLGVTTLHGAARFVSAEEIEVDGRTYTADHFVLASGAVPRPLGIPGEDLVVDSEAFMDLDSLPARIVFIGGGYVSFEFAHIAAAAGSEVTILHRGARALEGFDPDLADWLVGAYRERGIVLRTEAHVDEVLRSGGGLVAECSDGLPVVCDMVVHGAGRIPALDGLALDAAGVVAGPHGVEVDASMRSTTNPRVFAVGDAAASGAPLTPVATIQGRVVVANLVAPGSTIFNPAVTPSVVFSAPPLAAVGLTEEAARAAGLEIEVKLNDMSEWASSRWARSDAAGAKIIVERATDRIVGAHLVGSHAEEVINVFAAAMRGGLTATDLRSTAWAYPTSGSDIVYLL
jgi:glutathione reductase (NADPH)